MSRPSWSAPRYAQAGTVLSRCEWRVHIRNGRDTRFMPMYRLFVCDPDTDGDEDGGPGTSPRRVGYMGTSPLLVGARRRPDGVRRGCLRRHVEAALSRNCRTPKGRATAALWGGLVLTIPRSLGR